MSSRNEMAIEVDVSVPLGTLIGLMTSQVVYEDYLENIDETYFILNIYNGRTHGFPVTDEVK